MSCNHCSPEATVVIFTTSSGDTYSLNAFATDGDAVSFSATDQEGLDIKKDSEGNLLTAGSKLKTLSVTLRVSCEGARQLWSDYKLKTFEDCGNLQITDNCCTDEAYKTARITSVKRPNIGDSVDYFEIEIMGVLA